MRLGIIAISMGGLLPVMAPWAHHSAGSLYRLDRTITVDGVVTEYRFVNPHVRIYLEVTAPSGAKDIWLAEGQSKNVLVREGWDGSELAAGDRIELIGNPPRDGSHAVQWSEIRLSDGSRLGGGTVKDFSPYIERLRKR